MFLNKTLQLKPAYGRKYTTIKSFKEDFIKNLDFLCNGTTSYTSIRDIDYMINNGIENLFIEINNKNHYIIRNGKIQKGYLNETKDN